MSAATPATALARSSWAPGAWSIVVSAASRCAALKSNELRNHARIVEQVQASRIQQRQKAEVKLAPIQFGRLIANPMHLEALARPFACISVARHGRDAIGLQCACKLGNGRFRAEGRFAFEHAIEDNSIPLLVRDGARHGVG